jgi:hypothetical protein
MMPKLLCGQATYGYCPYSIQAYSGGWARLADSMLFAHQAIRHRFGVPPHMLDNSSIMEILFNDLPGLIMTQFMH